MTLSNLLWRISPILTWEIPLYICRVAELCDANGCVLYDDYQVTTVLADMARVYAFKRPEDNYISRAATPQ